MKIIVIGAGLSGLAAAYLSAQHADAVSDATKASTYIDRALKIDAENTALLRMSYILHASSGDIPAAAVESERRIAEATAREEGKPEAALEKIVEGRINGFYKDVVLLEQSSVQDSKKTVRAVLTEANTTVSRFARFEVGA